jgi:hypothetical protein
LERICVANNNNARATITAPILNSAAATTTASVVGSVLGITGEVFSVSTKATTT